MAAPANAIQTFDSNVIREELDDTVYNLDPMDTPFLSALKKGKCKSRSPEWANKGYVAPNKANKVVEGDVVALEARPQASRLKNHVQQMDKTWGVTDISQRVTQAGNENDPDRIELEAAMELKCDIESRMLQNDASVAATDGVAGEMAGAESYITTNVDGGVGYADGGYQAGSGLITAPVDGALRNFTEPLFKLVARLAWTNSKGRPNAVYMGGELKEGFSAFEGIGQLTRNISQSARQAIVLGAADVYHGDFGVYTVEPTRHMRTRTVLFIDHRHWSQLTLLPMQSKKLGLKGHTDEWMLTTAVTLKCDHEKSSAKLADVQKAP